MKKLIMGAAFGALMAVPAFAADGVTVEGTVEVDGVRDCVCELTGLGADSISSVVFDDMGINGASDPRELTGLGLFCNLPAAVTIESTKGFLRLSTNGQNQYDAIDGDNQDFTSAATDDFASGLDYTAEIVGFGLVGSSVDINGGDPESLGTIPPQNESGVTIEFNTLAGGLPLIAGSYSDTLIVSITPQAL